MIAIADSHLTVLEEIVVK